MGEACESSYSASAGTDGRLNWVTFMDRSGWFLSEHQVSEVNLHGRFLELMLKKKKKKNTIKKKKYKLKKCT